MFDAGGQCSALCVRCIALDLVKLQGALEPGAEVVLKRADGDMAAVVRAEDAVSWLAQYLAALFGQGSLARPSELSQAWVHPVGDAVGQRHIEIAARSEEHTSELQSLMRTSYAVFCLKKKKY